MMDNLARRRYTVRMELQIERKPDGFAGETYIVLPTEAFSDYIGHPLVRRLYLTDAGFFPHAAHHYRERSEGIEEYIFLCCTSGRGVVEVQGRTFPLRDNEALCIPRLCPHRYWADEEDPWSLLWVHFQGEDCGYYPLDRPQVCRFSSAGTVRRMEFLFNQLFRTLEQDYTLGNFIYLSQLLALILGETYARRQEDGTTAGRTGRSPGPCGICTATWTGNSRWRNSPPRWAPPRAPSARCSGSAPAMRRWTSSPASR